MIENNVITPKKTIFSGLEKFVSGLKEIRLHWMTPSEKSCSEFISDRWFFWTFMVSQFVIWTSTVHGFKSMWRFVRKLSLVWNVIQLVQPEQLLLPKIRALGRILHRHQILRNHQNRQTQIERSIYQEVDRHHFEVLEKFHFRRLRIFSFSSIKFLSA